jgi:hypothetical protein
MISDIINPLLAAFVCGALLALFRQIHRVLTTPKCSGCGGHVPQFSARKLRALSEEHGVEAKQPTRCIRCKNAIARAVARQEKREDDSDN